MASPTIGFIGLGIMGLPMATNLLDAGYDVVGHNRSSEPVETLVERGGAPAVHVLAGAQGGRVRLQHQRAQREAPQGQML